MSFAHINNIFYKCFIKNIKGFKFDICNFPFYNVNFENVIQLGNCMWFSASGFSIWSLKEMIKKKIKVSNEMYTMHLQCSSRDTRNLKKLAKQILKFVKFNKIKTEELCIVLSSYYDDTDGWNFEESHNNCESCEKIKINSKCNVIDLCIENKLKFLFQNESIIFESFNFY